MIQGLEGCVKANFHRVPVRVNNQEVQWFRVQGSGYQEFGIGNAENKKRRKTVSNIPHSQFHIFLSEFPIPSGA